MTKSKMKPRYSVPWYLRSVVPGLALFSPMLLLGVVAQEEPEPDTAVLFPWFAEILGVIVFFITTRYFSFLPFTAWMFCLGTFMGVGATRLNLSDYLSESIRMWDGINSEVLLLIFLPGMVFVDSYTLNVHLLQVSIWQCLIFAFPMVLAGTCLTALVAYFIFPYNWSFNLAMTFGAILSATDPVAVSALLETVGAPPRLKMHISGESLMNDGSAMVFFDIFSAMFLYELGIPGLGHTVSVGQGFALFFRMSLGGMCVGLAFGLGLLGILYLLDRYLDSNENVTQIVATITTAYLTYYVADPVCGTSGVIATMTVGVMCKAFGSSMLNDSGLMDSFWSLVDNLLNAALFALGGVVWGGIIANVPPRQFAAMDWGYLILLYVLLNVIRFFCVFAFYPITANIEIGTNWRETIFLAYGGLRGAVGISLAISLDNEVWSATTTADSTAREYTTKLFGMIGGIAFMTLMVNGSTAGYVLNGLGLTKSTKARDKLINFYEGKFKRSILDDLIAKLADPRFSKVDFAVVRYRVPFLQSLTMEQFKSAVLRNKESTPASSYRKPNLDSVLSFLTKDADPTDPANDTSWIAQLGESNKEATIDKLKVAGGDDALLTNLEAEEGSTDDTMQLRMVFIELVRYAYQKQIDSGVLDARQGAPGFVAYTLLQSLEFAGDNVSKRKPPNDWKASQVVMRPWELYAARWMKYLNPDTCKGCLAKMHLTRGGTQAAPRHPSSERVTRDYELLRIDVHRALTFIEAHEFAQKRFQKEFPDPNKSVELVLKESQAQVVEAEKLVESKDKHDVDMVLSDLLCTVLLTNGARDIDAFCEQGLLKETEAQVYIDNIQAHLNDINDYPIHDVPEEKATSAVSKAKNVEEAA